MNGLPLWIGLRYTRSSEKKRFLSLLSWFSLFGMILGVAALIIVLSVMNGFQQEIRQRMLALTAHGQVEYADGRAITGWQQQAGRLQEMAAVRATAPLVGGDVMLSSGNALRAAVLQGIDVKREQKISPIADYMLAGSLEALQAQRYGIVIGAVIARNMGLYPGDKVEITLPAVTITPFGVRPRIKQFTVAGVFEVGADMDASHVYVNLEDARRLYALADDQVHAVRFVTDDILAADKTVRNINRAFPDAGWVAHAWSDQRSELFAAIRMEKRMVTFMLAMVILVAACNLISLLSMMVADKRDEIAVLRMMGMGPGQALLVFLTQGMSLAVLGIAIGLGLGLLVAANLTAIVGFLERSLHFYLFDPSVYYVSGLPSHIMAGDVVFVLLLSLAMGVLFSLYPAWRAGKIQPVEALQYQ